MNRLFYLAIKHYLSTVIPALKHIDYDLRQYNQIGGDHILTTPALYFSPDSTKWTTQTNNVQRGLLSFTLALVSETAYGDDRDITATDFINHDSLESSVFVKLMNKRFALHEVPGYELVEDTANDVTIMESIVRTEQTKHGSPNSNLIITRQTFESTVFDYSALPEWQEVLATLNLDAKVGLDS